MSIVESHEGRGNNREIAISHLLQGGYVGCIPVPVQLPGYADPVAAGLVS